MKISEDIIPAILFFLLVVFFFGGVGYMIQSAEARLERTYNTCIEAGFQYISGDCVK